MDPAYQFEKTKKEVLKSNEFLNSSVQSWFSSGNKRYFKAASDHVFPEKQFTMMGLVFNTDETCKDLNFEKFTKYMRLCEKSRDQTYAKVDRQCHELKDYQQQRDTARTEVSVAIHQKELLKEYNQKLQSEVIQLRNERQQLHVQLMEVNEQKQSKDMEIQSKDAVIQVKDAEITRLQAMQKPSLSLTSPRVLVPVGTTVTFEIASRALDCPKLSPIYWAKTGATFTAKLPIYVWQSIFKKSAVVVENEQSVIEDVQTMNKESVIEDDQTMNKESLFDVSSNTLYKGVQQVNSYPFPPSYVIPLFTFKMPF